MGRWTEAERLFREAYVIFMDLGRVDKAAAVVQEYAPVLCALNKHADAAALLRWALSAADSGAIEASTRGPLTEQLAETLLRAGQPAQAIPHYEQAVALLEAGGRRTTCELATAVTNLGLAYAFAGQADQGDVCLRRGLDVAERRCPTALPATLVARAHFEMVGRRGREQGGTPMQGTRRGARGTGHGARGTGHGARGTGHGAQGIALTDPCSLCSPDHTGVWDAGQGRAAAGARVCARTREQGPGRVRRGPAPAGAAGPDGTGRRRCLSS